MGAVELGSLEIFAAVAQGGSITAAAQRLDYSPSNVTARMQQLEAELGTTLLYRRARGVTLTPAGRTLLGYVEQVLRLVAEARTAVREQDEPAGALVLGAMETTAAVRLPPLLAAYHDAFPQVDLTLVTGTSEELLDRVLGYTLDAAFIGGAVAHPQIEQEVAFREELRFLTGRRAGVAAPAQETLLVFRRGCSYRARLEALFQERGAVPYRVMEFGSLDAILGCVAAGMGVTLLPHSVLRRGGYAERLALQVTPEPPLLMETMLIRRRDVRRTRALDAWIALLRSMDEPPAPARAGARVQ